MPGINVKIAYRRQESSSAKAESSIEKMRNENIASYEKGAMSLAAEYARKAKEWFGDQMPFRAKQAAMASLMATMLAASVMPAQAMENDMAESDSVHAVFEQPSVKEEAEKLSKLMLACIHTENGAIKLQVNNDVQKQIVNVLKKSKNPYKLPGLLGEALANALNQKLEVIRTVDHSYPKHGFTKADGDILKGVALRCIQSRFGSISFKAVDNFSQKEIEILKQAQTICDISNRIEAEKLSASAKLQAESRDSSPSL